MAGERTYRDIAVFTVGGTDIVGRLKNARWRRNSEDIDIKAGKATRHEYLPGLIAESITGEAYITTDVFSDLIGTMVGFTVDLGGKVLGGSGVLSSVENSWASGDADGQTFEIKVSGTPTLAA